MLVKKYWGLPKILILNQYDSMLWLCGYEEHKSLKSSRQFLENCFLRLHKDLRIAKYPVVTHTHLRYSQFEILPSGR